MLPGFDPSNNNPGPNIPLHLHHKMPHMPHGMAMAPYMVKLPHLMMPIRGMPGVPNLSHGQPVPDH